MGYTNHNTTLRTNKHLNLEERFYVEKRIAAGDSVTAIATVLGRSRTTIYTELKRGSVVQIRQGKARLVYLADSGQLTYEQQRLGSFNTMKLGSIESFILWVEEKVFKEHWSFDAVVGYANRQCIFARNEMVCTKTLYNYLHQGLLGVKAIDLPLVVRRSMRKSIVRKHKRELGQSIELRDATIETRKEFGHWELDTVRGTKDKTDNVLVTLLEHKTTRPFSPWQNGKVERSHRIDGERFYSRKFNSMESFLKAHSRYVNRYNNIAQKVLNFKSPNQVVTEYFMNQKA